ncbi:MAG TPA: hypothetical protein VJT81_13490 [Burkholderiales bacterium]|nr:hypothetical protein [Burkholderiales bacterium]
MSILNLFIGPEKALLAVDTEGLLPDGSKASVSKMYALPHIHAVMGFRGHTLLMNCVYNSFSLIKIDSFDDFLEVIPKSWPGTFKAACDVAKQIRLDRSLIASMELVVVGWSQKRECLFGREFYQNTVAEGLVAKDIVDPYMAPWDESIASFRPFNVFEMERLARLQVQLLHEKAPGHPGGGRLIVCEMAPGAMLIRAACNLESEPVPVAKRSQLASCGIFPPLPGRGAAQ